MIVKFGDGGLCTNPECHCEVSIPSQGTIEGNISHCVCRTSVKKNYASPNFAYLEFLRVADPVDVREGSREG
jgi:hypothetical protein